MSYTFEPFKLKIVMTFNDNTNHVIDGITNNRITKFSLIEESTKNIATPLGVISSNIVNIGILNTDNLYTLSNKSGSLYGRIGNGVKLEISYTEDDGVNYENLGTFYVKEWNNKTQSNGKIIASIKASDILESFLNIPVPPIEVNSEITIKQYCEILFEKIGLNSSDYYISDSLTQQINLAITSGNNMSDLLNQIATSAFAFIYVGRDSKILVIDRRIENSVIGTISGSSNVVNVSMGPSYSDSYSKVKVKYGQVALSENKLFLEAKDLLLDTGMNYIENMELNSKNMVSLDYVRVSSVLGNIEIERIEATQDSISVDINNTNAEALYGTLRVYGKNVEQTEAYVIKEDSSAVERIGDKYLEVNNKLLQTKQYSEELGQTIINYIIKDIPYVKVKLKNVGLSWKVGDVVYFESSNFDITQTKAKIVSIKFRLSPSGLNTEATLEII